MDDKTRLVDVDPEETREWIESLEAVLQQEGVERAHFLLQPQAQQEWSSRCASRDSIISIKP